MEEKQILYVQLEESTDIVVGYSSTKIHDNDIEIIESEMEEQFLSIPIFYRYDRNNNSFVFDQEIKNKIIEDKKNRLTDTEKIEHLARQLADQKLKSMQNDAMMSNLMRQQALTKLELMNLKGEK